MYCRVKPTAAQWISLISSAGVPAGAGQWFGCISTAAPATASRSGRGYPRGMNEDQVRQLIHDAIRDHEMRVAVISGVIGMLLR